MVRILEQKISLNKALISQVFQVLCHANFNVIHVCRLVIKTIGNAFNIYMFNLR
jgi:hypothetical protein